MFVPLSLSLDKMRDLLVQAQEKKLGTLSRPHLACISRSLQTGTKNAIFWLVINGLIISTRIDPRFKEENNCCPVILRCSNRSKHKCKSTHRKGHKQTCNILAKNCNCPKKGRNSREPKRILKFNLKKWTFRTGKLNQT